MASCVDFRPSGDMHGMHSLPAETAATTCQRLMAERLELQMQLERQEARNQDLERRLEASARGVEPTRTRPFRDDPAQPASVRTAANGKFAASQPSGSRGNRKSSSGDAALVPVRTSARIQRREHSHRGSAASEADTATVGARSVVVNTAQRAGGFTHVFGDVLNLSTFSTRPVISPVPSVRAPSTPPVRTLPAPSAAAPDAAMDAQPNDQPFWHMLLNDGPPAEDDEDGGAHARALAAHCNDVSHILINDDADSLCGAGFDDPLENFTMDVEPRSNAVVAPGGEPHSTLGPLPGCFDRPPLLGGWGRPGGGAYPRAGGLGRPPLRERSLDETVKELQLMLDGDPPEDAIADPQGRLELGDWSFGERRDEISRGRERALEMRASMSQVPDRRTSFRASWTSPARGSGGAYAGAAIPARRQSTPALSLSNPFGPTDPLASPMRKRRVSSRGQFSLEDFAPRPPAVDEFEPSSFLNPNCKRRASSGALGFPEHAALNAWTDALGERPAADGGPLQRREDAQPAVRGAGRSASAAEQSSLAPSADTTFAPAAHGAGMLSDPFAPLPQHPRAVAIKLEHGQDTGSDSASFPGAAPAGGQGWPSDAAPLDVSVGTFIDKLTGLSQDVLCAPGAMWVDDLLLDESASKLDTSCLMDFEC